MKTTSTSTASSPTIDSSMDTSSTPLSVNDGSTTLPSVNDSSATSLSMMGDIVHWMKYARYLPQHQRRESYIETVARNERMHMQRFPYLEDAIRDAYGYVYRKQVLPSMRSMQFAGEAIRATPSRMFNCLARDTRFITSHGVKSFYDFKHGDTVTVMSQDGSWQKAVVKCYGKQQLHTLTFKRGQSVTTVKATKNHRWLLKDGSETTNLSLHHQLLPTVDVLSMFDYDNASVMEKLYWCYGFIYGDGTLTSDKKHSMVRLCDHKRQFENRFLEMGFRSSSSASLDGDVMVYTGRYTKETPNPKVDSPSLIRAFVTGYLNANGARIRDVTMVNRWRGIQTSSKSHAEFIESCFPVAGIYITFKHDLTGQKTNYGIRKETYRYGLYHAIGPNNSKKWSLTAVDDYGVEDVWCLEVENTGNFVLDSGIPTGNCAFLPIDSPIAFDEIMFLLLGGTGVGYSVQKHHVEQLPHIRKAFKSQRYLIGDSIEGWALAIRQLIGAYYDQNPIPLFDYSQIRPKGARLVTSGGKAPGPKPLMECLFKIQDLLDTKVDGKQLEPIECHDIACFIADAVLAGGIRRAAMIAFFSITDESMLNSKGYYNTKIVEDLGTVDGFDGQPAKQWLVNKYFDDEPLGDPIHVTVSHKDYQQFQQTHQLPWYYFYPQRGRANNSMVMLRSRIDEDTFKAKWNIIKSSQSGEPGIFLTNDVNVLANPCVEISLKPFQFCNLTTVNASTLAHQDDLNQRVSAAATIGTLQASYTDFHYLRPIWQETTEKEALLGVSLTGIASCKLSQLDVAQASQVAVDTNKHIAQLIGINPANRVTCIKPEGTGSLVLGTSSGIHAWHSPYYIRNLRVNKDEPIYQYLLNTIPELVADEVLGNGAIISIPIQAPDGAIFRNESTLDLLERVRYYHHHWIQGGHQHGVNTHNISCTINLKPNDDEDGEIGDWLWNHRDVYNGLAFLPECGGNHVQLPFETCTQVQYEERLQYVKAINLEDIKEIDDNTLLHEIIACAGGACEW